MNVMILNLYHFNKSSMSFLTHITYTTARGHKFIDIFFHTPDALVFQVEGNLVSAGV